MTDVEIIRGNRLKMGDTAPNLRVRLLDSNGNAENITGATASIKIKKSDGDTLKVDSSVSIFDADTGVVEYNWSSNDTDTSGVFDAEIKLEDGDTSTYPNDSFFRIEVIEGL
jgi:hypothetical protein